MPYDFASSLGWVSDGAADDPPLPPILPPEDDERGGKPDPRHISIWNEYTRPFIVGWSICGGASTALGYPLSSWQIISGGISATVIGLGVYVPLVHRKLYAAQRVNSARLTNHTLHIRTLQRKAAKGNGLIAGGLALSLSGAIIVGIGWATPYRRTADHITQSRTANFIKPNVPLPPLSWQSNPDWFRGYTLNRFTP
jgi:hypothetical protein